MEMRFTETQYRRLLDVVYTGIMVINGDKIPQEQLQEYGEVEQYIYSMAKEYGFEDLVGYDEDNQRYYTTKDFDRTEIGTLIDQYHDTIFWGALALNLAKRDALVLLEKKEIGKEEVLGHILEMEAAYSREFLENGLQNLYLDSCQEKKAKQGGI